MKDIEKEALDFLQERGWDKLRPCDLAKSISIEAGELLELFQWTSKSLDEVKSNPEEVKAIAKELADVLLYSFYLGLSLELDIEQVMKDKLAYAREKFPPELVKNSGDVEPGTEDVYKEIKQNYRRTGLS